MMLFGLSNVSPAVTGPCSAIKKTGHYKCIKIMDLYKPFISLPHNMIVHTQWSVDKHCIV